MKLVENGIYKFDSAIQAAKTAKALGNNSKINTLKAFLSRKVEITDGKKLNIKTSLLISKAISKSKCCKISAKSEINQIEKNKAIANPEATLKDTISQKDTDLHRFQLVPELRGLALKPKDADFYFDVLEFDGVGNIIAAKRQLLDVEIKAIKSIAVTSLNVTNSAGERTHSKSPVESLLYFNHYLENAFPDKTETVEKWQGNIREFWLRGNISPDRLKSFYQLALKEFKGDDISRVIGILLADLEKEKYPAQLYDNMFGRIFSSELGRELVENPTMESLKTARMISDQIKQDVANFNEHCLNNIAGFLQGDSRFWFPKCPSLGVFMGNPTLENLNNCLSGVDNGFDVIKISKILMCVFLTKNNAGFREPYISKANHFYTNTLLPSRTGDDLIRTNIKAVNTNGQYKKIIIQQDAGFKTNSYGSKLRFQPRNEEDTTNSIYSTSVPDKSSLNHEKSSIFEQNMLRSGHSLGLGISGTTNMSCFFYEDMAKTNDGFSKDQAFLNTLAYILYDGGHSISESLAVFKAVSKLEEVTFESDAERNNKGKEIIESSLVNYKDLVKCGNSESQGHILQSLNRAYDNTTKSFGKHAYSANK